MRAPGGFARARERGFVLVGVVMFVLALTILGLSLYALSGYEGQFLTDTQAEEQALFRAEGGMVLAHALLSVPPYSLTQSHLAESHEGIVRATAWQLRSGNIPDSTGYLDWGRNVYLRISTQVGNQTRVVEQEFTPQQRYNPYKRLFTATTAIDYTPHDANNRSRSGSTELNGPIWQYVRASSDTSWLRDVDWRTGRPMLTVESPVPDVAGYLATYYGPAPMANYADSGGGEHTVRFDAGSDAATAWFRSPRKAANTNNVPSGRYYDFYCTAEMRVEVRGTCVWMAPAGIRFDNHVRFRRASGANANPTIVIVAGPNGQDLNYGDYRDMALWLFDRGVEVEDGVRVIVVSSGHVRIEMASSDGGGGGGGGDFANPGDTDPPGGGGGGGDYDIWLPYLNVFADRITLMGPRAQDGDMVLTYHGSMDALMDDLIARGVLPAASGLAAGGFVPVAGSWRTP